MTKEQRYTEQLKALGVWEECFAEAVHSLCILERELSRTMKLWKATAEDDEAPSPLDPLYAVITTQRRDINALRDSLGLTPKGMQKLRGKVAAAESSQSSSFGDFLDALKERAGG